MQRNGASRKRSADRGRGARWLPAAVERLESRYAMDGGGMSPTVALPPYSSALGIGSETRPPVVVAPVQAAAAIGVAAPAPWTPPRSSSQRFRPGLRLRSSRLKGRRAER